MEFGARVSETIPFCIPNSDPGPKVIPNFISYWITMKIKDILNVLEEFAPPSLQEPL